MFKSAAEIYEASVDNNCSSSEAGGEAHVSFTASSHTHLVQPPKCQFTDRTILIH